MDTVSTIGKLHREELPRDAIHIAVVSVISDFNMNPGETASIDPDTGKVVPDHRKPCGIVDPFLKEHVYPGSRFWLFMNPGTITSLRHEWEHPALPILKKDVSTAINVTKSQYDKASEWLRHETESMGVDYKSFVDSLRFAVEDPEGDSIWSGHEDYDPSGEFWNNVEIILGKKLNRNQTEKVSFHCSC
jgi:hypothetical protein